MNTPINPDEAAARLRTYIISPWPELEAVINDRERLRAELAAAKAELERCATFHEESAKGAALFRNDGAEYIHTEAAKRIRAALDAAKEKTT